MANDDATTEDTKATVLAVMPLAAMAILTSETSQANASDPTRAAITALYLTLTERTLKDALAIAATMATGETVQSTALDPTKTRPPGRVLSFEEAA